nr:aldehyde dehydrogenase family protein [Sinirhodobacter populi]
MHCAHPVLRAESLCRPFTEAFLEKARSIRVGDGMDPDAQMGPVADHRRVDALEALTAGAEAKGARLLCGGKRLNREGYFFPPTVFADLPDEADVLKTEPF